MSYLARSTRYRGAAVVALLQRRYAHDVAAGLLRAPEPAPLGLRGTRCGSPGALAACLLGWVDDASGMGVVAARLNTADASASRSALCL